MDSVRSSADILNEVIGILSERENNYDSPIDNFARIANLWNNYLSSKPQPVIIEPEDVAIMMILMKIAREQFKKGEDNLKDLIGYAVCYARILDYKATREEK